jgi:hypothetical protein
MKRWLIIIAISLFGLMGFETGQFGSVYINYNFESIEIDSGPDTFELFEASTSEVSLSSRFAFRGRHSLHIQDYVENSSFPEFQGYFPEVNGGTIEIGFALMTPTPSESFNIALAGSNHFSMTKDGIGFWLFNDSGSLRHMSDSIPKRLFDLTAFKWYWFEIVLDVSRGKYSLIVSDDYGAVIINLDQQKHPTNVKKSGLDKYSFAGDLNDRGNANLYIDEFVLRTDYADSPEPLLAPGRRSLFVDQWNKYHKQIENLDVCLAPQLPYDFINIYNTVGLKNLQENVDVLKILLSSPSEKTLVEFTHENKLMNGVSKWALGCLNLKTGDYYQAIKNFEAAQTIIGVSPATQMGLAIVYANAKHEYGANAVVANGIQAWPDDARWFVLSAALGFISGRAEDSEAAISAMANSFKLSSKEAKALLEDFGWLNEPAVTNLKSSEVWNKEVEDLVVAEQYYFSLLWQDRYNEAQNYADDVNRLLRKHRISSPIWLERAGDAALFAKDFSSAEREYKKALKAREYSLSSLMKLADVYFLQGRVDDERDIRESIFGALNYEQ